MNTINERISYLISSENLKKTQFAERVGLSQAYVSQICSGVRTPSDRLIADICREFHVRREWLETGEGPMKYPEPDGDMALIDRLLDGENDDVIRFVKNFLSVYLELTPDSKAVIADLVRRLHAAQGE